MTPVPRKAATWFAVASLSLVLTGCRGGDSARSELPATAATVTGTPIPSSAVVALKDVYRESVAGQPDAPAQPDGTAQQVLSDRQVLQAVLSFRIKVVFMEKLAARMGITATDNPADAGYAASLDPSTFQHAGLRPEDLVESAHLARLSYLMAARLLPKVDVTAADLREAYNVNKAALAKTWKSSTSLAFFSTPQQAQAFRAALARGASFDHAAAANNALRTGHVVVNPLDPSAVTLVPIVSGLSTGAVSAPFPVGPTTGVAKVDRRVDLPAQTLAQAKGDLTNYVVDHKRKLFFADWFQSRFRHADVKVDPYYGHWDAELPAVV